MTRRAFLIGGAAVVALGGGGAAAVDAGGLPGRSTLFRTLGLDGSAGVVPTTAAGTVVSGSFVSKARLGATVGWSLAYPPGSGPGDRLPVVVVLHGYGDNHDDAFGAHLGLQHFLAQDHARGGGRFAIASVDGGNTYWHRRSSGEDAGAMVSDEFLPLLAARGLRASRADRIGLLGWSMGAYGALLLASRLGSARVAAVAAESPALWHTAAEAAGIAFDSAADFREHTLFGRQPALAGIGVRVDCGTGDGFYPAARDYVAGFPAGAHPAGGFTPGGHNLTYWRRIAPAQLAFLGSRLG